MRICNIHTVGIPVCYKVYLNNQLDFLLPDAPTPALPPVLTSATPEAGGESTADAAPGDCGFLCLVNISEKGYEINVSCQMVHVAVSKTKQLQTVHVDG